MALAPFVVYAGPSKTAAAHPILSAALTKIGTANLKPVQTEEVLAPGGARMHFECQGLAPAPTAQLLVTFTFVSSFHA